LFLAVLLVAALSWGPSRDPPPPNEPGVPAGPYLDSCRGCRIFNAHNKKLLSCQCPKFCGTMVRTSIDLDACKLFDNENGILKCSEKEPNGENIPEGPYLNSCSGCVIKEKLLFCSKCRNDSGKFISFQIEMTCSQGYSNLNGKLFCVEDEKRIKEIQDKEDRKNGPNIPKGNYLDSCQGCSVSGSILTCKYCLNNLGKTVRSSVNINCPYEIHNKNGNLQCLRAQSSLPSQSSNKIKTYPKNLPKGDYIKSCTGCRFENNKLNCIGCKTSYGTSIHSEIIVDPNCDFYANLDGHLTCERLKKEL